MKVRFWGVRGSIPVPGKATNRYGGNTSCVEVRPEGGARPVKVLVSDLKAVFFVKSLIGNAAYDERKEFGGPVQGRKVQVTFKDGEVLVGSTQGYQADRPGFFLVPADPQSNNDRIYVVARAVQTVSFLS